MAKNLPNDTFCIESKYLKHIEPLLDEYFNIGLMLMDDICQCVIESNPQYKEQIDFFSEDLFRIDFHSIFIEDDSFKFTNTQYLLDKKTHRPRTYLDIANEFPEYFSDVKEIQDAENLSEHTKICLCLSYMEYIYYKYTHGYYKTSPKYLKGRKIYTFDYYYEFCTFLGMDTQYYIYMEKCIPKCCFCIKSY